METHSLWLTKHLKDHLTRKVTWLESRVQYWADKEQEYRITYGARSSLPAASKYSLIHGVKKNRKDYQAELKQARIELAAL